MRKVLITHNLPSGRLKNDFGEGDETIILGVEQAIRTHFLDEVA
jgi:hypothetical protein